MEHTRDEIEDEYIIINKTDIQKRIEELGSNYNHYLKVNDTKSCEILSHTIEELKQLLSQSTPLIPEIEKAWTDGNTPKLGEFAHLIDDDIRKQDYITNLKLDI